MKIDDISPTWDTLTSYYTREGQSASGKTLCAALSSDGARAYVGGHSGVWRSDDGGLTWWHPEWVPERRGGATAPGALLPPNVYDLAVHAGNPDVVFAAASHDVRLPAYDGLYRSTDGGLTWSLSHRFDGPNGTVGFVGCIAAAPDDPDLLLAAGTFAIGRSSDGGNTWIDILPATNPNISHVVLGRGREAGRRAYASGDSFWYSSDGGINWLRDPMGQVIGQPGAAMSPGARSLAIHPYNDLIVYAVKGDLTVWKGVFPDAAGPAAWTKLPSPPIPGPNTDSGATFVLAHPLPNGQVVLYVSDRRYVHAANADPASPADYAHVDVGLHADPHGLALTPDFHPWAPDASPPSWGKALLVNDGGAQLSTDGTQTWQWTHGLSTLNAANVGVNTVPGGPTSITFGGGDNLGFSSADGGDTWQTQDYLAGDNDCAFADPRQPTRMLLFAPRSGPPGMKGEAYLFVSPDGKPPDTAVGGGIKQQIYGPRTTNARGDPVHAWNVDSFYANYGYRPLVFTLAHEAPRPDGDFVTIRWLGVPRESTAKLLRTTAISQNTSPSDWDTNATSEAAGTKAFQVGPDLPAPGIGVVQGSGGHDRPTFYISDVDSGGTSVWKLAPGSSAWEPIVPSAGPGPGPAQARRFFVDSYRPERVYVLADDSVYRTDDGGKTWAQDPGLDAAVTESGSFPRVELRWSKRNALRSPNPEESVLRDMQFDPVDPNYRLAIGIAGVFLTIDGTTWSPLLRSSAMALQPTSMLYDPNACERTLYVGTMGRGVLRLRPLPPDWTFPIGSLGSARGRVTLLRVHEVGSAYGPRFDQLNAEVVVTLDTEPGHAFGLELRQDANEDAASGMLGLLRDAFNGDRPIALDFIRNGCRTGRIVRVMEMD